MENDACLTACVHGVSNVADVRVAFFFTYSLIIEINEEVFISV